jgi:hypothetical protein
MTANKWTVALLLVVFVLLQLIINAYQLDDQYDICLNVGLFLFDKPFSSIEVNEYGYIFSLSSTETREKRVEKGTFST